MRQASDELRSVRQACGALAIGLPLLAACPGAARAADHAFDRDNQFGAVTLHESMQSKFPKFDRSKELNAATVNDTDRSPYLPDGIRAGTYMIFPEVAATIMKDDNIFGAAKGEGDIRRELSGTVKMYSHMPRHVLDFMFSGRVVSFEEHSERNYADGMAVMQTRLDVNHGHAFVGNFMTKIDHEERRDGETPVNAKHAVEVWNSEADVGFVRSVGRLSALIGGTAAHREYHAVEAFDGSRLPQSYRDTDVYSNYLKLRYQVSPGYTLLARISALMEQNRGNATFNRSNHGYEAMTGVDFEMSRLLRVSLEGGYAMRDYSQDALADIKTAVFNGKLTWLMSPTLTFYLTGGREINATGVDKASGRVDTRMRATLEYEFQRNLVLTTSAEYVGTDFMGSTRHDDLWVLRAGAQYYFNKHVYLSVDVEHDRLASSTAGAGFDGNKIMAAIKFRH